MDRFMQKAVELANHNVDEGGTPFGAVLVKNGEVIAEGVNELHKKFDVSGHAELLAIRKAQEQLQTHDLSGSIMYASGEPCPMCMTAIYYAGIETVYFGGSIEEAKKAGMGASVYIYNELALPREKRAVKMIHMPLAGDVKDPMKHWQSREGK
ncbi:nucleoside deaminase [Siminovitchia sp. 179-K 8D1 HS]|uniref:nucleoside deaminase n=1 Tax=Siminovitchia sp. 179-K 8D1 HS TaxID=3142385 RepID=UPI0039A2A299